MKKLFTFFSTIMLSLAAFAATEAAWYNDVKTITNGNQYYIYSVNGAGFVQGGNNKVKPITPDNYNSESNLLFTIEDQNGAKTHSGSHYLSSYQAGTNGPIGDESTAGTNIYWTSMNNGKYWNIHGKYNFLGDKYACLQYDGGYSGLANVLGQKETHTNAKSQWYLISPAHYDRHFAIYFYDLYKESISDYTQYENQVPAAYYTALAAAYAVTYDVTNPEHSKEAVQAHHADLKALYDNAPVVAQAYSDAKATINALEAVEDKGEDFEEVTAGISAARQAIENAMSVEALNTAVSAPNLKAIDPITFSVTEFTAISSIEGAAASVAERAISYVAADQAIINAEGMAVYAGTTTLTATAEATDAYYKFVRSAQVTVVAPTTYGDFAQTTCDEPVEFNEKTYTETTQEDVNVGLNFMGGDSIVHVSVVINHASFGAEEMTIAYGADEIWNGIELKDSTVGVHTVIFDTVNAVGCDSTVTLTLTVTKQEALEIQQSLEFCEGDSVEFRGVWYKEAQEPFVINAEGEIRDTVINVTITVNPKEYSELQMTDTVGKVIALPEGEWLLGEKVVTGTYELQEADTAGLEFRQYAQTPAGCEALTVLFVTVEPKPEEEQGFENINAALKAEKFVLDGVMYIRRGDKIYTTTGSVLK